MRKSHNSKDRDSVLEEKQPGDMLAEGECREDKLAGHIHKEEELQDSGSEKQEDAHGEETDTEAENIENGVFCNKREKYWKDRRIRINRIKKYLLFSLLILMLIQTVVCIILCIKVYSLQEQVNIMQMSRKGNFRDKKEAESSFAYASVESDQAYLHKEDPKGQMSGDKYIGVTGEAEDSQQVNQAQEEKAAQGEKEVQEEEKKQEKEEVQEKEEKQEEEEKSNSQKDNTTEEKTKIDKKKKNTDHKAYEGKKVYLTFDDGPSAYTDEILDILAKYHVKATFFVIGKEDKEAIEVYQRIAREGHAIGMHSYSHKYQQIYNSLEEFDKDFTKLSDLLYDTIGYVPEIFRFPGGSGNQVNKNGMEKFIRYLNKKSIVYFDWNVINGDATGVKYTKKQLENNVLEGVKKMNTSIVLMHDTDTKGTTVESLPRLIKKLLQEGAEILPLDKGSVTIQQIKADSIK